MTKKWIKTKKLPPIHEHVLLVINPNKKNCKKSYEYERVIVSAYRNISNKWILFDSKSILGDTKNTKTYTHWMNLPTLPQDKQ